MENILFFGDVYLDRVYKIDFELDNYIFNLDAPITRRNKPSKNKIVLKIADEKLFTNTFTTPPQAVSLANNQILDYGVEGFDATVDFLRGNKIEFFGAGRENDNYNNPYLFILGDKTIAIFGYACDSTHPAKTKDVNVAKLNLENIKRDIEIVRGDVDFIILQMHWGDEEIPFPKYSDVQIAHQAIDLGADLIIGHHSHVIQSFEVYRNKHIFYGIGDFILPDLDVESMFDGERFTDRFIKRQRKRNRESVVVNLDSELRVDYFTTLLEDNVVKVKDAKIPTFIPKSEEEYETALTKFRKYDMVEKFLEEPQVPSFGQIKRFLGI